MKGGKRPGAGRKKGQAALGAEKARQLLVEQLAREFAPIVTKAIEQAKNGDHRAREWLADRAYGRVSKEEVESASPQQNFFTLFVQAANARLEPLQARAIEVPITLPKLSSVVPSRPTAVKTILKELGI